MTLNVCVCDSLALIFEENNMLSNELWQVEMMEAYCTAQDYVVHIMRGWRQVMLVICLFLIEVAVEKTLTQTRQCTV